VTAVTKPLTYSHPQLFSQIIFERLTIVVVMSPVNWWKSSPVTGLLVFFNPSVQWIFLRVFGKAIQFAPRLGVSESLPQIVRIFPTTFSHLLHAIPR